MKKINKLELNKMVKDRIKGLNYIEISKKYDYYLTIIHDFIHKIEIQKIKRKELR